MSDEQDRDWVQVDIYGIKVTARKSPLNEEDPGSWRQVAERINHKLMSITAGIFGALDDTVKGVRNLVRAIGGLPGSAAEKIRDAHERSDIVEARKQLDLYRLSQDSSKSHAFSALEEILLRKWKEGNSVRLYSDGERTVLMVLKPTEEEVQKEIVQSALAALPEYAKKS